jgi:hypothetical protein
MFNGVHCSGATSKPRLNAMVAITVIQLICQRRGALGEADGHKPAISQSVGVGLMSCVCEQADWITNTPSNWHSQCPFPFLEGDDCCQDLHSSFNFIFRSSEE